MILKQLRISRHFSQEQLADMSGLNVRTIQRIESGQNASVESLKCLAAALDVDIDELKQETFVVDKTSKGWQSLPIWLKVWFFSNFLTTRMRRAAVVRVTVTAHASGFLFCLFGVVHQGSLIGGLIMLATGYLFSLLLRQGDRHGIWYDPVT